MSSRRKGEWEREREEKRGAMKNEAGLNFCLQRSEKEQTGKIREG
jgi:hypothetical protein